MTLELVPSLSLKVRVSYVSPHQWMGCLMFLHLVLWLKEKKFVSSMFLFQDMPKLWAIS